VVFSNPGTISIPGYKMRGGELGKEKTKEKRKKGEKRKRKEKKEKRKRKKAVV